MSDESTTVVVCIPTYNNESSIAQTIERLLGQTRPPDRIVFCDKSDDRTPEIIEEYRSTSRETEIDVFRQRSDGVAGAYNELLEYVSGEYDIFATIQTNLQFGDDWVAGHLEVHREHPEIDMVTGDYAKNAEIDREVTPDDRTYYIGRNFSAKAGTLEAIDGWDPNFLRGEDWDMRIRLAGEGTRVYTRSALYHDWAEDDPYVTLSKARRKPTSVTFLAKYGTWYLRFHPSHVGADLLGLGAVASGGLGLLGLAISPLLGGVAMALFVLSMVFYVAVHNYLRGTVDGSRVVGPARKQLLNGIAVVYAIRRIASTRPEWNRTGFDPEQTLHYGF